MILMTSTNKGVACEDNVHLFDLFQIETMLIYNYNVDDAIIF